MTILISAVVVWLLSGYAAFRYRNSDTKGIKDYEYRCNQWGYQSLDRSSPIYYTPVDGLRWTLAGLLTGLPMLILAIVRAVIATHKFIFNGSFTANPTVNRIFGIK